MSLVQTTAQLGGINHRSTIQCYFLDVNVVTESLSGAIFIFKSEILTVVGIDENTVDSITIRDKPV
jgi:hypothetical protein